MAKRKFRVEYSYGRGLVEFEVDPEKFTNEHAQETLDFFSWNYDKEGDPIEEVVKKYALEVFRIGADDSPNGIIRSWNQEGFAPIDGSEGIKLTDYESILPDDSDIDLEEVTHG